MKPVVFEGANDLLGGWTDPPVADLAIHRIVTDGSHMVTSCWELEEGELERIVASKRIFVTALGITHPPLALEAAEAPPRRIGERKARCSVVTAINDEQISKTAIVDPFAVTTIRMGFWDRIRFLFSPGRIRVSVGGPYRLFSAMMRELDLMDSEPEPPPPPVSVHDGCSMLDNLEEDPT